MSNSYQSERKRLLQSFAAISNDNDFWQLAKEIHEFQLKHNEVFKNYNHHISDHLGQLAFSFLPISFFKREAIKTGDWEEETIFTSSGTTGAQSQHYVRDKEAYLRNTERIFQHSYGPLNDFTFLCLLPSYLERTGSSLIAMSEHFIKCSDDHRSQFYLYDHEKLYSTILDLKEEEKPTVLLGVSYALLDFTEKYALNWPDLIVIKTGGMKGRRKEMNSQELDNILKEYLGVRSIHAEYGMTECFSQLYSHNGNSYFLNLYMKAIITDLSDPFHQLPNGKSGRINLIDLANIDTCAFIATDDVGHFNENGELVVLGRVDNSDLRGCNLLL